MATTTRPGVPKSDAVSKGYNFASTWEQVTAVKVALSGSQNQKLESGITKPLKEHAFASPEKIAELLQKVNTAIDEDLPRVLVKMRLYLQNSSTRAILFKPIKTNILEAHVQVLSLLKKEYTPEDRQDLVKMVSS